MFKMRLLCIVALFAGTIIVSEAQSGWKFLDWIIEDHGISLFSPSSSHSSIEENVSEGSVSSSSEKTLKELMCVDDSSPRTSSFENVYLAGEPHSSPSSSSEGVTILEQCSSSSSSSSPEVLLVEKNGCVFSNEIVYLDDGTSGSNEDDIIVLVDVKSGSSSSPTSAENLVIKEDDPKKPNVFFEESTTTSYSTSTDDSPTVKVVRHKRYAAYESSDSEDNMGAPSWIVNERRRGGEALLGEHWERIKRAGNFGRLRGGSGQSGGSSWSGSGSNRRGGRSRGGVRRNW